MKSIQLRSIVIQSLLAAGVISFIAQEGHVSMPFVASATWTWCSIELRSGTAWIMPKTQAEQDRMRAHYQWGSQIYAHWLKRAEPDISRLLRKAIDTRHLAILRYDPAAEGNRETLIIFKGPSTGGSASKSALDLYEGIMKVTTATPLSKEDTAWLRDEVEKILKATKPSVPPQVEKGSTDHG